MKKEFPEFYQLTEKQLANLGKRAVIAFDASFLLDLYRYSPGVTEKMFSVVEGLNQQVWLPHRAAYEFHNNRINVIESLRAKHSKVLEHLKADGKKLTEQIENACRMHPLMEAEKVVAPIRKSLEKARVHLTSITDKHSRATLSIEDDAIWRRLTQIFAGKIGSEFPDEELKVIEQEAKRRFERKIPPGYEDTKKEYPFGDFILWKQLLEHCKTQKLPGVFVTSDMKEDWWLSTNGRKLGPRPELRREFLRYTGQEFHLYETTHFVEVYAPKFLVEPEEPILEINQIQKDRRNDREVNYQWWESTGDLGAQRPSPGWASRHIERNGFLVDRDSTTEIGPAGLIRPNEVNAIYAQDNLRNWANDILYKPNSTKVVADGLSELARRQGYRELNEIDDAPLYGLKKKMIPY